MLILGRRHLEALLVEYVEHYNAHRPHGSLGQRAASRLDSLPAPIAKMDPSTETPTIWAASSTSTGSSPGLVGWSLGTRRPHPQIPDGLLSWSDWFSAPTSCRADSNPSVRALACRTRPSTTACLATPVSIGDLESAELRSDRIGAGSSTSTSALLSRAGGFSTHTRRRSHVGAITATPYREAAAAIRLS